VDNAYALLAEGLMTVREAASLCRVSRAFLYAAMDRGELPYCKLGRARRIPRRGLLEFMGRGLRAAENGDRR
jgi:excisionase family DNA binding protein